MWQWGTVDHSGFVDANCRVDRDGRQRSDSVRRQTRAGVRRSRTITATSRCWRCQLPLTLHGYRASEARRPYQTQQFPPQPAQFRVVAGRSGHPARRDRRFDRAHELRRCELTWDVPPGEWLILRLGHTTTGKDNHPAPESGRGLECDKFNPVAAEAHFNALVGKLIAENPMLAGSGKVFVSTHIDSWEVGTQNWTPRMRDEFQKRRGYDLWPFLPVFTGRVVDSLELSERFLWDLRQTVSDLIVENYAGQFRRLANQRGLRLSIEAYGEPADDMTYAGQADEPMSEFWSWAKFGAAESCTEMASAAHTYGKRILGAEAFTATDAEKWLGHPGNVKDLGDWAFCEGVNRFVFHRYAAQPWVSRAPGMSMGPWGLHYERTQTWWEQSKAWHEYLARCQYLLQQGLFVADVCYLQPEGAPRQFVPPPAAVGGAVRAWRIQLRRLYAGSGTHANERCRWPHCPARRNELPGAGIAGSGDDDPGAIEQDQGSDRSRGHRVHLHAPGNLPG